MLYTYKYIYNHKIHGLNKHLLIFFRKIRSVNNNAQFSLNKYFHSDFVKIIKGTKLEKKFRSFFKHFKSLNTSKQDKFYKIIKETQSLNQIFEDTSIDCNEFSIDGLQKVLGDTTTLVDLMSSLYKNISLKDGRWNIYDHYYGVYKATAVKICPFCGVEILHKLHREDYDHLAAKSIYPLFAINMRNLAPMCAYCNEKIKLKKDVFYKDNNKTIRRPFAYPYKTSFNIKLDFNGSIIPQTDINFQEGDWRIDFSPNHELVKTWLDVFEIENRYIEDYIKEFYKDWITHFLLIYSASINSEIDLKDKLKEYSDKLYLQPLHEKNIIKSSLFKYFSECNNSTFYSSMMKRIKTKLIA